MISATAEPRPQDGTSTSAGKSPRLRPGLWLAVAVVFVIQVALLFLVGNPPPAAPLQTPAAPKIYLSAKGSEELLALQDPTLFVLPHRDNFSGDAWLKIPTLKFAPTNWTEPPRPLSLPVEQLGATFVTFMKTNPPPRYQLALESGLDADRVDIPPMKSISVPSSLRVEGDLGRLRLLTPLRLPPQTNSELLANTVVQLVVNAEGYPFSPVILAGSGSDDADQSVLTNFAKAVRFAPAQAAALGTVPGNKMTMGKLIFEWQTVLPAPTNAPASIP
jgi:hypothetical protein